MKDEIYIVGSTAHSLLNFRFDLVKSIKKNNPVTVLSQDYSHQTFKKFNKIKVNYFSYGFKSFFLFNEFFSVIKIASLVSTTIISFNPIPTINLFSLLK